MHRNQSTEMFRQERLISFKKFSEPSLQYYIFLYRQELCRKNGESKKLSKKKYTLSEFLVKHSIDKIDKYLESDENFDLSERLEKMMEITERRQLEKELEKSRKKFKNSKGEQKNSIFKDLICALQCFKAVNID